ncbi:MAG TPA: iron-sulfur cluster assembly scaffold protein [Candidatus Limnocylindrales bacterium]|nr:iron-sulfur cluster assembly scaffold protein [Candidatus Limnocylindrales bacterium]
MYDFYRENILDHGMHPRNRGVLDPALVDVEADNPLCGDRLRLTLRLDDAGRISEVGWDGQGCAISQAAASMLGEELIGKTLDEAKAIQKDTIFEMIGIPLSMNRVKCALLSLKVLTLGLYKLGVIEHPEVDDEDDE